MTYQEFKEAVIGISAEMQVADYELYFTESDSTSVEIYKEEIKEYSTDSGLGVCYRCIRDKKAGYASTENLTPEEARSLVVRALENAKSIESETESFIHGKGDSYATLPEDRMEEPSGGELTEAALALQKELYAVDSRVADGTQSYMAYGRNTYALYNSRGLDLEDRVAYTLCMGLLSTYSSVFSAEAAQKGMSLLQGKEGEKIAADMVTLIDDPMHPESLVKRTFDGEGVAAFEKNVIEEGVLKTLLHNLSTAAKAGVKSTGNGQKASYASTVGVGPFTFYLKPVEGTEEELLAAAGNGICIKGVSGLHAGANPVTGDFSLLAEGFCVEDGRKTKPVKNITVSGNFFTLLKEIDRIGVDLKFIRGMGGKCGSPSVLVRDMTVAGQ